jgi:hypothetical protein
VNYLSTLTSPAPAHYGAERQAVVPDSNSFFGVVRLLLPDGSSPYAKALDPERKNKASVRVLTHLQKDGKPTAESREITVTRAYWDANAKSTGFMEGFEREVTLWVAAIVAVPIALGAGIGSLSPAYGAARGAGVGAAFVAGSAVSMYAISAKGVPPSKSLGTARTAILLSGTAAAAGTAFALKRR